MQWPGSFCDTRQGCCFPDDTKPAAAFGIHGLWPNYAKCRGRGRQGLARAMLGDDAFLSTVGRRGKCWPEYCDDGNELSPWEIRDLVASLDRSWPTLSCKNRRSFEFWSYEWKKHGTCSNLEPQDYFARALAFKATGQARPGGDPRGRRDRAFGHRDVPGEQRQGRHRAGHRVRGEPGVQPRRGRRGAAVPGVPVRGPGRQGAHRLPARHAHQVHRPGQVACLLIPSL